MFLGEAVSFSVQSLRANPVRSLLTGLGMVIGTASVILVVTISLTSRDFILQQIEGVGSNVPVIGPVIVAPGVDATWPAAQFGDGTPVQVAPEYRNPKLAKL